MYVLVHVFLRGCVSAFLFENGAQARVKGQNVQTATFHKFSSILLYFTYKENMTTSYSVWKCTYSRTSMARTLMARLPWLFRTRS